MAKKVPLILFILILLQIPKVSILEAAKFQMTPHTATRHVIDDEKILVGLFAVVFSG
jgi:hypothetical protein